MDKTPRKRTPCLQTTAIYYFLAHTRAHTQAYTHTHTHLLERLPLLGRGEQLHGAVSRDLERARPTSHAGAAGSASTNPPVEPQRGRRVRLDARRSARAGSRPQSTKQRVRGGVEGVGVGDASTVAAGADMAPKPFVGEPGRGRHRQGGRRNRPHGSVVVVVVVVVVLDASATRTGADADANASAAAYAVGAASAASSLPRLVAQRGRARRWQAFTGRLGEASAEVKV